MTGGGPAGPASATYAPGGRCLTDAQFRIGSATKMFTASLVLQLAAEGRLGLDDPVQRWLPGALPASYPTVTVGQLLDHTSGLPKSTEDAGHEQPAWVVRHRFDWHSPRAVVRSATRQPMAFAPGTKQQYNGVNYFLAGLVVERVDRRSPTPASCAPGCSSPWASTTPTGTWPRTTWCSTSAPAAAP